MTTQVISAWCCNDASTAVQADKAERSVQTVHHLHPVKSFWLPQALLSLLKKQQRKMKPNYTARVPFQALVWGGPTSACRPMPVHIACCICLNMHMGKASGWMKTLRANKRSLAAAHPPPKPAAIDSWSNNVDDGACPWTLHIIRSVHDNGATTGD